MTTREQAALLESASVPLVLWPESVLRHVRPTVAPPPPSAPDWLTTEEFDALLPELGGCYRWTEGEVVP